MRILFLSLSLFFSTQALAQSVKSLFGVSGLKTQVLMPFQLRDQSNLPLSVLKIEIAGSQDNCHGMLDPFISSNFLVKCQNPEDLIVHVFFLHQGQPVKVNYGPVTISRISENQIVEPTQPEPGSQLIGQRLFQNRCQECHQNENDFLSSQKTIQAINSAIATQPRMRVRSDLTSLTQAERQAISDYLFSLP